MCRHTTFYFPCYEHVSSYSTTLCDEMRLSPTGHLTAAKDCPTFSDERKTVAGISCGQCLQRPRYIDIKDQMIWDMELQRERMQTAMDKVESLADRCVTWYANSRL